MTESTSRQASIFDLIPTEWFSGQKRRILRIRCYEMARTTENSFEGRFSSLLGEKALILLFWGKMQYVASPNPEHHAGAELQFSVDTRDLKREAPEAPYTVLVTTSLGSEFESRQVLDLNGGIVTAVLGRNAAYQLVFDNIVDLVENTTSVFGPTVVNPYTEAAPDLSESKMQTLRTSLSALSRFPELERNRIELALHWHEEAARSPAADQFLKRWIALEALGMSGRENVRPLNEALALSYQISLSEAQERFGVGRIFGFRSKIVHGGHRLPIHGFLERYLDALFRDVLFQRLGLPSEGYAAAVAALPNFNLRILLHEHCS